MKKLFLGVLILTSISSNINANTITGRQILETANNAISTQLGFLKKCIAQQLSFDDSNQGNAQVLTQQNPALYHKDLSSVQDSIQDVITEVLPQEEVSVKQMNASLRKYLNAQYPNQKLFGKHAHFPAQKRQAYVIQKPHFLSKEEVDFIREKRIEEAKQVELNIFRDLLDEGNKLPHLYALIQEKKWDELTDEELQLINKYEIIKERKLLKKNIFEHDNFDSSLYTDKDLKNFKSPRASLVMLSILKDVFDQMELQPRPIHSSAHHTNFDRK